MPLRTAAAWSLVVTAALAGCEPRIEEPVQPARSPAATSTSQQAASAASASAPASRCIRPTPPTPVRALARDGGVDPACPPDPETPPVLRRGRVVFPEAGGRAVSVEIAETDRDRQRGLMYRTSMPEDQGMIFVFRERREHPFWMHDTCIPLDMLFLDDDGTIVGIEENAPTLDDSTFTVGCPSRYVLEVNAGWSRRHGVKAGQRVRIEI